MSPVKNVSPREALRRLKEGNQQYLRAERPSGNISPAVRKETAAHGQKPFAVVIACSDSRVIPEDIFSCGIGDLFVIRTAGNTIDRPQLASIEYALHHLGTRLILVLGHTRCGAVGAALQPEEGAFLCLSFWRKSEEESAEKPMNERLPSETSSAASAALKRI